MKISGNIRKTKKHDVSKIENKLKELGYLPRLEVREDQLFYEILVKKSYVLFWLAAISLPIFFISFFLYMKHVIGWVFFYYLVFLSATIVPVTYDGLRNKLHERILQNVFQKKTISKSIFQFSKAGYLLVFGAWALYFLFLFFYTGGSYFLPYLVIHIAVFLKLLFGFIETKTSYENAKRKIFYIIGSAFVLLTFYLFVVVLHSIGLFITITPTFVIIIWIFISWNPFSYDRLLTARRAITLFMIVLGSMLIGLIITLNEI